MGSTTRTTRISNAITERIRYGAVELKASANRNLATALGISIAIHIAAILLFLSASETADARREPAGGVPRDTLTVILPPADRGGNGDNRGIADPVEPNVGTGARTESPAVATPIIVDDDDPAGDSTFATVDQLREGIGVGDSTGSDRVGVRSGGDGDGDGVGDGSGIGLTDDRPGDEPLDATREFLPDTELPTVDFAAIAAALEYPEIAREHNIEGAVYVRTLIGLDGRAERVSVASSSNRIFERPALEAVSGARFGVGTQNGVPVRVWIDIPIRFRLE